ncbi:molybdopterin-synthase adenylyltransferase MoeB [Tatumella sp. TA1]|uniref:molybdopterin-synthase adenylyltransferase MoeB n=1 Tax=Rosenbergiella collisarenosi TaxID=1544695 RepID=UPI0008F91D35|nr:molybdopterin-synthase adenylyltransferase MoeB [Rosenbergiella collisarenosi]MBT0722096.1 molybdopterin-synthase adenylyltransferase MoeB [Rosenbergiella collisarenosi]QGX91026.1 molybdopterin-synthase adenylyltransferase MoeB [Tatumella sp. TA1]
MMSLSDNDLLRYDRQIVLKGFDIDKQQCLADANVMIVGMGGLGCAVATYLAASGVGALTLVDPDIISLSNLPRQILYSDTDCGQAKVDIAKQQLSLRNPDCTITTHSHALEESAFWRDRCAEHDLIIDCTDQLSSRQHLNRCCFATSVPLISGAAIRMEGYVMCFSWQHEEPCYECLSYLFGEEKGSCVENGVMSPLTGVIGSLQAMEAIRYLSDYGTRTRGKYLLYDAMNFSVTTLTLKRNPYCKLCA